MTRLDRYIQLLEFLWAKLAVSEGAVKVAVRAYPVTPLTELCGRLGDCLKARAEGVPNERKELQSGEP